MPVILRRATQYEAGYSPEGGVERCGYCRHFVSQGTCNRILGPVSPRGWCRYFSREVWLRMEPGTDDSGIGAPPATLDLSFMTGTLPAGVTFTRASTATYFNASGTLQTANLNLLTQSTPTSTNWSSLTNVVVTNNAGTAPDGSNTAVAVAASTASGQHLQAPPNVTVPAGATITASIFAKANGLPRITFMLLNSAFSNGASITYDLTTGVATAALASIGAGTAIGSTITSVGGGWYRMSITAILDGTSTSAKLAPYLHNGISSSFVGDGISGLLIWGGQIETASAPSPFALTSGTTNSGPRFDYDPAALTLRGLLIEEQRTNGVLQSVDFTQANWAKANCTLVAGTSGPNGGAVVGSGMIANSGVIGSLQQSYTNAVTQLVLSCYVKAAAQTSAVVLMPASWWNDATNRSATFNLINGSLISQQGAGLTFGSVAAGNGWWRLWISATPDKAAASAIQPFRAGGNGDGTSIAIYGWAPQLEAGAFPTSYIPTTSAAVTRSQDFANMPTGAWFSPSAGTLVGEALVTHTILSTGNNPVLVQLDDTSQNNLIAARFTAFANSTAGNAVAVISGGAATNASTTNNIVVGVVGKVAATYNATTQTSCINGGPIASTTTGGLPTSGVNFVRFGTGRGLVLNGWLCRTRYWNTALSSSQLQSVTT